jgi:hypothetical protein
MLDRFKSLEPEMAKDVLTHYGWSAERLASRPDSAVTPLQVTNAVNHMYAAATFWLETSGNPVFEQLVRGASGIIDSAGTAIGIRNAEVGSEIRKLGEAIQYIGIGAVQTVALSRGFHLRKTPEDMNVYRKIAMGKMGKAQLANWLLNVPAKPNVK